MKRQMKLNYNGFIEHIADVLAAEDIETVQNEAWSIEVGIRLLNGYMEQLAKRAIIVKRKNARCITRRRRASDE